MKKKQIITYGIIGVGILLILAAAGMLLRSIMQYREQEQAFSRLRSRLSELYRAEVFPSEENVEIERENRAQLEDWFAELLEQLGEGNIVRDDRSPSQFIGRLERARNSLREQADRSRVRLPERGEDFAFGFERYAGTGELPSPDDVPRLTEQLLITTQLTRMLYESEISHLKQIRRDVFEAEAEQEPADRAPTRRGTTQTTRRRSDRAMPADRNPGILGEDDMFATYRFVLEFEAREEALMRLLNALADSSLYTIVRRVQLRKDVPSMIATQREATDGEDAPREPEADVSFLFGEPDEDAAEEITEDYDGRGPRLGDSQPVSGIEMETPMEVRLEVDVYKFRSVDETLD